MNRTKKKVFNNISNEDANEASKNHTAAHVQQMKLEAKMNGEINKIKDKYQDEIAELQMVKEETTEMLQVYAQEQKSTWGKKKSVELLHTIIGFRTGTPKVTKDKKFTWDAVTELAKKLYPNLVRTTVELDKKALIALSEEDGFKEVKQQIYVDVVQDETFYVEPIVVEVV